MSQHVSTSAVEVISGPSFRAAAPSAADLDAFRAKLLTEYSHALWDYWLSKRTDDGIPFRSEIQPAEMKEMLPYLLLWERVSEAATNRIRLAGTALVEALLQNPAQKLTRDVFPAAWEAALRKRAGDFYDRRCPQVFRFSMAPFSRSHVSIEFLALPLRRDADIADMGIGIAFRLPQANAGAAVL